MTVELESLTMTSPQHYRRSVMSAICVENNQLLNTWTAMEFGESIEGYCLDAPDVLPLGCVRDYNGYKVSLASRPR